ncbi:protein-disulfide isomerase [Candidatus Parcubacteria bacterium]|nr:MAG: protein-disulfide isomerase [Candidatus Parcubacteria bacterium]
MEETESIVEKKGRDNFLPISILVAAVLISGSILYAIGRTDTPSPRVIPPPNPNDAASLKVSERDVILGDPNAPVTLIEYGDYQCPFCGQFFSQVEEPLREEYIKTGKVKMVFRNFQFLGPESVAAAEAAECAKDQKQYWAYHDSLYREEIRDGEEHNGNLNRDLFLSIAADLKLNVSEFVNCVDSRKYGGLIEEDLSAAKGIGVNSTPTTFINGEEVRGAQPYSVFKAVIERLLQG